MSINSQQIIKYLSGSCSEEECLAIEQFKKESSNNKLIYEKVEKFWNQIGQYKREFRPDAEVAWHHFRKKLKHNKRFTAIIFKIAASLVLLIASVYFVRIYLSSENLEIEKEIKFDNVLTAEGEILEHLFSDSSLVAVNKGSSIKYNDFTSDSVRIIKLTGEAFFKVNASKKDFIVEASEINIRVKGTSFNVNAYDDQSNLEVSVYEGIVEVSEKNNLGNKIVLTKGEKCKYSIENHSFKKKKFRIGKTWFGKLFKKFSNFFKRLNKSNSK